MEEDGGGAPTYEDVIKEVMLDQMMLQKATVEKMKAYGRKLEMQVRLEDEELIVVVAGPYVPNRFVNDWGPPKVSEPQEKDKQAD